MSGEIHLLPSFPDQSVDAINIPDTLQESITQRIKSVLGYKATNPYFIKFINEFGHHDQLRSIPNEAAKRLYNIKMSDWEKMFTDSFYRAAVIAVPYTKRSCPQMIGINMDSVMQEAEQIIKQENAEQTGAWEDIGYQK